MFFLVNENFTQQKFETKKEWREGACVVCHTGASRFLLGDVLISFFLKEFVFLEEKSLLTSFFYFFFSRLPIVSIVLFFVSLRRRRRHRVVVVPRCCCCCHRGSCHPDCRCCCWLHHGRRRRLAWQTAPHVDVERHRLHDPTACTHRSGLPTSAPVVPASRLLPSAPIANSAPHSAGTLAARHR